jgi:hypothetical protein
VAFAGKVGNGYQCSAWNFGTVARLLTFGASCVSATTVTGARPALAAGGAEAASPQITVIPLKR